MPIPNEDSLRSLYDRVQAREPSEEVQSDVRAMERALAQRRTQEQAYWDDLWERYFA